MINILIFALGFINLTNRLNSLISSIDGLFRFLDLIDITDSEILKQSVTIIRHVLGWQNREIDFIILQSPRAIECLVHGWTTSGSLAKDLDLISRLRFRNPKTKFPPATIDILNDQIEAVGELCIHILSDEACIEGECIPQRQILKEILRLDREIDRTVYID